MVNQLASLNLPIWVTEFDWSNRPREEDTYPPTDVRDLFCAVDMRMKDTYPPTDVRKSKVVFCS